MDDGGDYDKDEENCINDELSMRGRKELRNIKVVVLDEFYCVSLCTKKELRD